jgi:CheY-like chemotaxis protein
MTQQLSPLILIVDDFPDGLEMYSQYFIFKGYRVVTARDGAAAIAVAREHAPDLILMDLAMPKMNGTLAMKALRTDPTFDHVPIVALTAHAMSHHRIAALRDGFDEFIPKPCLPDAVFAAVDRLLASARQ